MFMKRYYTAYFPNFDNLPSKLTIMLLSIVNKKMEIWLQNVEKSSQGLIKKW